MPTGKIGQNGSSASIKERIISIWCFIFQPIIILRNETSLNIVKVFFSFVHQFSGSLNLLNTLLYWESEFPSSVNHQVRSNKYGSIFICLK